MRYMNPVVFCDESFDVEFGTPGIYSNKTSTVALESSFSKIRERFPNSSIYHINDEPLRCLAALKEGVDLTEEVRYDWSIRWDIAVEETTKFFNQIQTFKGNNQAVREVKMLRLDNK
jgi:hypothetical protein